ncbi:hypothetical protein ACLOJK_029758 [Asimina triloba]
MSLDAVKRICPKQALFIVFLYVKKIVEETSDMGTKDLRFGMLKHCDLVEKENLIEPRCFIVFSGQERKIGQKMKRNGRCWRKEVDEKLKRLHSLLFDADAALERSDFASAQILSLRLLGFLDSVSQKAPSHEQASIHHIHNEVLVKIDAARRSLALESDR